MATGYVGINTNGNIQYRTTDSNGFWFYKVSNGQYMSETSWYTYYNMKCDALGGACDSNTRGRTSSNYYKTSGSYYYWPSSSTPTQQAGTISSRIYYTVTATTSTTGSSSSGGTITGGGVYWEDSLSSTITAKPNTGFLLTSLSGYSGTVPTKNEVSFSFTVSADVAYTAQFQKYYNVVYNANGGENAPVDSVDHYYRSNTSADNFNLSNTTPTREGYTFLGWSTSSTATAASYSKGASVSNLTSGNRITLYAVWKQYTITFDANGGSPTPSSIGGAVGDIITLPPVSSTSKENEVLGAWRINDVDYAPGSSYTITANNYTATAQWRDPNIVISKMEAGQSTSSSVTGIGTLKLYSSTDNFITPIATQDANDTLRYEGALGITYRVTCELGSESTEDFKWNTVGISNGDGTYSTVYDINFVSQTSQKNLTYYLSAKARYHFSLVCYHNSTVSDVDNASVISPSVPDYSFGNNDYYVVGRKLVISAVPNIGRKMTSANVGGMVYSNLNNTLTIEGGLSEDTVANLIFTDINYSVLATKDAASETAISSVSVLKDGEPVTEAVYGDVVSYRAEPAFGYSFAGWYDTTGMLVSSANTYSPPGGIVGDLILKAKAKVSCSLDIHYTDTLYRIQTCSLAVNSVSYVAGSSFDVILGYSFTYALSLGQMGGEGSERWKFNAWFNAPFTERVNPLPYAISGEIYPTAALNMVAEVTPTVITNHVLIGLKSIEGETISEMTLPATQAIMSYPVITQTISYNKYDFTVTGTQYIEFTAIPSVLDASDGHTKYFLGWYTANGSRLSIESAYSILVNAESQTIYAYYQKGGQRTTILYYSSKSDRDMGTFAINDNSNGSEMSVSETSNIGTVLTITATARNGYKFFGWYAQPSEVGDPYSTSSTLSLTVNTNRSLYAYFVQDPNSVYEWEGGSSNKTFEWRSKTYTLPRPSTMGCCRADTEGYPVERLFIDAFSAPDNSPRAISSVELNNLSSQDARRIPVRRPERYFQICVKNDHEVDAIFIGTNMLELNK